jgi:hypothetical protein
MNHGMHHYTVCIEIVKWCTTSGLKVVISLIPGHHMIGVHNGQAASTCIFDSEISL